MKINSLVKYTYYTLVTLILLGLGISFFFLYNNFYQTLTQARIVYILKSQVAFETIDMSLWYKIIKDFEDKKNPRLQEDTTIIDPFAPLVEVKEE